MKKNILILSAAIISITLLMAFTPTTKVTEKSTQTEIVAQNWGRWKTTDCFRHLKYRIKKKSYQNEWAIEFENGYNKSISMSVKINDGYGGDRFTIASGSSKIRSAYYTNDKNATYISFGVNKVKFGDTSWGGPYASCD